jgi:twitching motility protein PilT
MNSTQIRNSDGIEWLQAPPLRPEDTDSMLHEIASPERLKKFWQHGDVDFTFSVPNRFRVRVNAFKQRGSIAIASRLLQSKLLGFSELGLPDILNYLSSRPHGLVVVTGPTGSGKSTTLAAIIDKLNRERQLHIITLEDPIEYLHRHNQCVINQREVGEDTSSFSDGLRAALRENPDVIMVGEMRDLETISIALTAAETGHLVLATLHTSGAPETINRMIDPFPPHQQPQIRTQLYSTLEGIVSQLLLPRKGGLGQVLACEVMMATPAVKNQIREGKTHHILSQIQTGSKHGMISLDMSLRSLYQRGLIDKREVLSHARDPENLNMETRNPAIAGRPNEQP